MRPLISSSVLLVCVSTAFAAAQTQPTSTNPSPTGNPHACGTEWYPQSALAAGEEGTTTLAFRIGVDGVPKNVSVAAGSTFGDLDDAAEKCVATWRYQPAMAEGKPVEVDWKASVEWKMPAPKVVTVTITPRRNTPANVPPPRQPIGSQVCMNPMKPPAPLGKTTTVMFWVRSSGNVEHLRVVRSSGDDKLDDLALSCASQWRYTPLEGGSVRHIDVMFVPIPW